MNIACSWPTFNDSTETLLIAYQSIFNTTNQWELALQMKTVNRLMQCWCSIYSQHSIKWHRALYRRNYKKKSDLFALPLHPEQALRISNLLASDDDSQSKPLTAPGTVRQALLCASRRPQRIADNHINSSAVHGPPA